MQLLKHVYPCVLNASILQILCIIVLSNKVSLYTHSFQRYFIINPLITYDPTILLHPRVYRSENDACIELALQVRVKLQ